MTTLPRVIGWSFVGALLLAVCLGMDQVTGRPMDVWVDAFVAANGALTLAGAWHLLAQHSPWAAYWVPRLLSEMCHFLFDLLWIAIFALLGVLLLPLMAPVLALTPPVIASVLLVRRLRSGLSPDPLPFWS